MEPKLLTEAEVRGYFKHNPCADVDAIIESFRERGLIAEEPVEEPVDPLLVEAREIAAQENRDAGKPNYAHGVLEGRYDKGTDVRSALAALRRGMKLQRDKLTREVLGDAIVKVFGEGAKGFGRVTPDEITRLHAALQDQLKEAGRG